MSVGEKLRLRVAGKSLTDRVHDTVLSMILTLEIKPRERLSEVQFAKELGVSRTPVREAFLKLESLGFLDIVPQSGTIVAPMRTTEFNKSQFMREAFELALVRRAVELDDNSRLCLALEQQLKLQEVHSELGDEPAFFASDEGFTRQLRFIAAFRMSGQKCNALRCIWTGFVMLFGRSTKCQQFSSNTVQLQRLFARETKQTLFWL